MRESNEHYLKLFNEARKSTLELVYRDQMRIRDIYKEVAKEFAKKAKVATKGTLTERFAKDYLISINEEIELLNRALNKLVNSSCEEAVKAYTNVQLSFFDEIGQAVDIKMDNSFRKVLSAVNRDAVIQVVKGSMYHDHKGLSERIWVNGQRLNDDVGNMLERAIASKKSAYEFAKDVEVFVDPEAKKDWDWKKVYPGSGKKVDYNAQRLARTAINHAAFLSNMKSCDMNPFVEGIKWRLSSAHIDRQVIPFGEDECDEYASQDEFGLGAGVFEKGYVPVPHPQCLCSQLAYIPKSTRQIGNELADWVNGKPNNNLDKFERQYGFKFL